MKIIIYVHPYLLALSLFWSSSLVLNTNLPDAGGTAREFYGYHLKNNMGFTEKNIENRRRWLCVRLYDQLLNEAKKPSNPNVVPRINGDPFTDSQEYPKNFHLEDVKVAAGNASIKVVFQKKPIVKWVIIKLKMEKQTWKICNVYYQDGENLIGELKK